MKQGRWVEEVGREVERLVREHGMTSVPGHTSWILPDARRVPINSTHARSLRLPLYPFMETSGAMRVVPGVGIEVAAMPTAAQVEEAIADFEKSGKSLAVDVANREGEIVASKELFSPSVGAGLGFVRQHVRPFGARSRVEATEGAYEPRDDDIVEQAVALIRPDWEAVVDGLTDASDAQAASSRL